MFSPKSVESQQPRGSGDVDSGVQEKRAWETIDAIVVETGDLMNFTSKVWKLAVKITSELSKKEVQVLLKILRTYLKA